MRRVIFLLLVVLLLVFGWWRFYSASHPGRAPSGYTPAEGPRVDLNQVQVLAALDNEFTRLVEAVVPSVVSITSRSVRPANPDSLDPLELFFGPRRRALQTSLGSGVIVSKEGHILTNNHVIAGMSEITVQLTDGRVEPARLIGADPETDIAVLQIKAASLTPLALGDSDNVRVGQAVFAIGNPFGLQESVTQGIISAKGRRTLSDSNIEYLQTDAAVNQGNSGGPLLNLRGEIIGINTAIYSKTGANIGISFALPSNVARQTLESVLRTGRVVRGYLGVVLQEITKELAEQLDISNRQGAIVFDVAPGSPAEDAGLQPGDIVRQFDGRPVTNLLTIRSRVAELALGTKVRIDFERNGRPMTATAEIAEAPPSTRPVPAPGAPR